MSTGFFHWRTWPDGVEARIVGVNALAVRVFRVQAEILENFETLAPLWKSRSNCSALRSP